MIKGSAAADSDQTFDLLLRCVALTGFEPALPPREHLRQRLSVTVGLVVVVVEPFNLVGRMLLLHCACLIGSRAVYGAHPPTVRFSAASW